MRDDFYGLIGGKLGHSFSPQIHDLILKSLNVKGTYNLFEVKYDDLESRIKELTVLGARGVNVTIPYKTKIMQYLDYISPEAQKIGAVNTIKFKDGMLSGYNTDYYGFGAALKNSDIDIEGKSAVILGTGGASKAVVQYLTDNYIKEVIFVSRTPGKAAAEDTKDFRIISYEDMDRIIQKDIIINCTPCGMYPDTAKCPVSRDVLSKFSTAVDLIYNPLNTLFLKQAWELGLKTSNGLYMLVSQAVASQEIWQDTKINKIAADEIYEAIKINIRK